LPKGKEREGEGKKERERMPNTEQKGKWATMKGQQILHEEEDKKKYSMH
jgi:hypothetical protein